MIRAGQLHRMPVETEDGRRLGRVEELHTVGGELSYLVSGGGGLFQRWGASRRGRRVAWDRVRRIEAGRIVVSD